MMPLQETPLMEYNDTELVAESLAGRREAFGHIVERYQSLICSLAYCATGSLSQSEDLAQETFVTAWRQLSQLREPSKLRAWLCGIARNLVGKSLRRDGREPSHAAEPLEAANESAASEPLPPDQAISKEEEAILWRSLEKIPEVYREPLVLFYRQHESVERVAVILDLSEDAVKQRLSRGRRLLHEQVASFVEGALRQSAPGRTFTLAVMALLPMQIAGVSTAAAGVAAAAKAGATTKGSALLAATTAFAGLFTGFVSTYLGYKMSMEGASSEKERRFIRRFFGILSVFVVVPLVVLAIAIWARPLATSHPDLFTGVIITVLLGWIPAIAVFIAWARRRVRELDKPIRSTPLANDSRSTPVFEYRSKACLLGLPLIHARLGANWTSQREAVKAWIAIADDLAIGVIFAFGGMAVAPIAFGGFALGGIVFGGFGVGILCYAGFAVGVWALGGFAAGLMALGGCAAGWTAAAGGVAISHQFALGGVAIAAHANNEVAKAFISNHAFFQNAFPLITTWLWPTLLLSLVPSLLIWRATRKRRRLAPL
jgi:RNA polymerase sigma factor (sigma-70 family)